MEITNIIVLFFYLVKVKYAAVFFKDSPIIL